MHSKKFLLLFAVLLLLCSLPVHAEKGPMKEEEVIKLAEKYGKRYGICPELLQSIAWQESSYRPAASNNGCEGLMQINARWHRDRMERLGVKDLYNPEENMETAADYLAELFKEYEDVGVVLMFYSGDGRAEEYSRGEGEMSDYVQEVLERSAELEVKHGK